MYWFNLFWEIVKRLLRPLSFPLFTTFFVGVVIGVGGFGFWIPYFSLDQAEMGNKLVLAQALATYFLAIVATAFADLTLTFFVKFKEANTANQSTLISLWAVSLIMFLAVGVLGAIGLVKKSNEDFVLKLSYIGAVIALFLWWIANFDNEKLKESSFDKPYNPQTAAPDSLAGEGVKNGTQTF